MDFRYKFNRYAVHPRFMDPEPNHFSATDKRELWEANLQKMPADWHYRSKEVFYRRDDLGYRSKNLYEIDKSNFFITYGCSYTEGVGLAEDETWPYVLGSELEMDYLNHGLGGTGSQVIFLNSMCFISNTKLRPKFVVCQWPSIARQIFKRLDVWTDMVPQSMGKVLKVPEALAQWDYSVKTESYLFDSYIAFKSTQAIWNAVGVPVYNWCMNTEYNKTAEEHVCDLYFPTDRDHEPQNMARDGSHWGRNYHIDTAKKIAQKLRSDPKFGFAAT